MDRPDVVPAPRPPGYGSFLKGRLRRIYPPFLAVFAVYLVLSAAVPSESKLPADPLTAVGYLAENLLLLPGLTGTPPLVVVTWTLGYEVALYLTLPLVVGGVGLRHRPTGQRVAALAAAGVGYAAACAALDLPGARALSYFAGFLAYEFVATRGRPSAGGEAAAWGVLAGALATTVVLRLGLLSVPTVGGLPGLNGAVRGAVLGLGLFALAACAFGGGGVLGRVLTARPLVWLGDRSYSFYLTHGLVLKAAAVATAAVLPAAWHGPALFWAALAVCSAGAVAAAVLLYVAVERRCAARRAAQPAEEQAGWVGSQDTLVDIDAAADTGRHPVPAERPSPGQDPLRPAPTETVRRGAGEKNESAQFGCPREPGLV